MTAWRRYDDLAIGDCFPDRPARFEVTAQIVRDYRSITTDSLIGADPAPVEGEEAPPTLAAVYIRPAQNALNGPPGGIHAKQHFTFHRPAMVGDVLTTTLEVREKYERKGRRYLLSETRTSNQDGDLVTTGAITQIWGQEA